MKKPLNVRLSCDFSVPLSNKTHELLRVLLLYASGIHPLTLREVATLMGRTTQDASRIISRLSLKGRVSRKKDQEKNTAYFYYFLNAEQKRATQFLLAGQHGVKRASAGTQFSAYNEAELNALAQLGVRTLVVAEEIEAEKQRLTDLIDKKERYVNELKNQVRNLKRKEKRLDARYEQLTHERNTLDQSLGQESTLTLVELAGYLSQLLTRPAFAGDARLKNIATHYHEAVARRRAER